MLNSVTQRIDGVISATTELREIRAKLAAIDEERTILEERAQRILETLAHAAEDALHSPPVQLPKLKPASLHVFTTNESGRKSLTDRVIEHLANKPGVEYGATDLAASLGLTGDSVVNTIRGTLSRLASEGRIIKTGYGRYKAGEGKSNAPSANG